MHATSNTPSRRSSRTDKADAEPQLYSWDVYRMITEVGGGGEQRSVGVTSDLDEAKHEVHLEVSGREELYATIRPVQLDPDRHTTYRYGPVLALAVGGSTGVWWPPR